jgi:transposase
MEKVGRPIKRTAEAVVKDIRRQIVLKGLKGEESISGICRKEGIAPALYYRWSKDFIEADKKRLNDDTERDVNPGEVKDFKDESQNLKLVVTE